ncbi:hypothetical protein P167DRAFT_367510 [Morchella conica CCBAS932]|uniref:Secreted protein n=1 Tax=Morchella conica CCBAS932 TaxID=1392247 RepID=A0A3N4KC38_9PEZI|nr:hypothetical protein P167DRAFT_367510 [Morchella conica CCBAS932]
MRFIPVSLLFSTASCVLSRESVCCLNAAHAASWSTIYSASGILSYHVMGACRKCFSTRLSSPTCMAGQVQGSGIKALYIWRDPDWLPWIMKAYSYIVSKSTKGEERSPYFSPPSPPLFLFLIIIFIFSNFSISFFIFERLSIPIPSPHTYSLGTQANTSIHRVTGRRPLSVGNCHCSSLAQQSLGVLETSG